MSKVLVACFLLWLHCCEGTKQKLKKGLKDKCKPKKILQRKVENADCFEKDFKLLYLEANGLFLKANPNQKSDGIVERALGVSKRENLTTNQLKVLTDVIHYQVNRTPLLKSSSSGQKHNSSKAQYDVVHLGSDILREQNIPMLQNLSEIYPIGERLLHDFEVFSDAKMRELKNGTYVSYAENIAFQATSCHKVFGDRDYAFFGDDTSETSENIQRDAILLPTRNLPSNESACAVSSLYFKNLQTLLRSENSTFSQSNATNFTQFVNSHIISLAVLGSSRKNLTSPVKIRLKHLEKNKNLEMRGVFWNFKNDSYNGYWSDAGCQTTHQTGYSTTFKCNHLTNFAILVTGKLKTKKISSAEHLALSVTSSVGCFLSMIGEVVTLAIYAVTKVQSKRRFILMNTVLCLLLAQAIFLAGIEQGKKQKASEIVLLPLLPVYQQWKTVYGVVGGATILHVEFLKMSVNGLFSRQNRKKVENVLCAVIAASISYFFLASFFWMLNMAIHLYLVISFVFPTNFRFWYFMISGYVLPLFEVLLAAAVTQGNGFGNPDFCWFTFDSGAIWIFLGPVSVILMVNIVIAILVLIKMLKMKCLQNKRTIDKTKQIVRAIIVLTPSLGLTWIFGLFTVGTESVVMQFVFAILNSLQGIFILVTCCVLDKKVREELLGILRHPKRLSYRASLRQISPLPLAE
ncbi:adhesion G protein-coupled receptor L1-like [Rhopilema esculentum]|uniref:adhesion G protein-coupled receptor L1-like n=1 Tax=Rhopilema esculentum TaxID=499914 RepID=UPI0031E2D575